MNRTSTLRHFWLLLAGLGLALSVSGCARVTQEELDARLDELRSELEQADRENAQQIRQAGQRVSTLESRVSALERDLGALRSDFDGAIERMEAAIRFSAPVHFAYDRAEIRGQDRPFLERFASVIRQYYTDATVTVEGFADPAGSAAYNLRLGQRRADAVRQYLVENGRLDASRVRAVSYGEDPSRLIRGDAQGPGDSGVENRRVSFVVDFLPARR